jgi:hypothetical protein
MSPDSRRRLMLNGVRRPTGDRGPRCGRSRATTTGMTAVPDCSMACGIAGQSIVGSRPGPLRGRSGGRPARGYAAQLSAVLRESRRPYDARRRLNPATNPNGCASGCLLSIPPPAQWDARSKQSGRRPPRSGKQVTDLFAVQGGGPPKASADHWKLAPGRRYVFRTSEAIRPSIPVRTRSAIAPLSGLRVMIRVVVSNVRFATSTASSTDPHLAIQGPRRFIAEQDLRRFGNRPGHGNPLLPPERSAGEAPRAPLDPAGARRHPVGPWAPGANLRDPRHVLGHCHARNPLAELEHKTHMASTIGHQTRIAEAR